MPRVLAPWVVPTDPTMEVGGVVATRRGETSEHHQSAVEGHAHHMPGVRTRVPQGPEGRGQGPVGPGREHPDVHHQGRDRVHGLGERGEAARRVPERGVEVHPRGGGDLARAVRETKERWERVGGSPTSTCIRGNLGTGGGQLTRRLP